MLKIPLRWSLFFNKGYVTSKRIAVSSKKINLGLWIWFPLQFGYFWFKSAQVTWPTSSPSSLARFKSRDSHMHSPSASSSPSLSPSHYPSAASRPRTPAPSTASFQGTSSTSVRQSVTSFSTSGRSRSGCGPSGSCRSSGLPDTYGSRSHPGLLQQNRYKFKANVAKWTKLPKNELLGLQKTPFFHGKSRLREPLPAWLARSE